MCMHIRDFTDNSADKTSKQLKLLNINTQSINNKKADTCILNIIAQSQPDIIIATEKWLKRTFMASEVIPPNYMYVAYRKDRTDGYG